MDKSSVDPVHVLSGDAMQWQKWSNSVARLANNVRWAGALCLSEVIEYCIS